VYGIVVNIVLSRNEWPVECCKRGVNREERGTGAVDDMRRPHILLVEGERERRSALACYLRKEGFQVSAAADEEAMYRALGLGDIDMVLLSIDLPDRADADAGA
jgi:PleD family two-component response regulator